MGILTNNLVEEAKKIIRSHTADDLQEWIDSYNHRIALAEQEDNLYQPVALGKINGTPHSAAKSKGIPAKKSTHSRATAKV